MVGDLVSGTNRPVLGTLGITAYAVFRKRGESIQQAEAERIPWGKNVLAALGMAYPSLVGVFVVMILFDVPAETAYNAVSVPFVALVGGTLAVVKDLI